MWVQALLDAWHAELARRPLGLSESEAARVLGFDPDVEGGITEEAMKAAYRRWAGPWNAFGRVSIVFWPAWMSLGAMQRFPSQLGLFQVVRGDAWMHSWMHACMHRAAEPGCSSASRL